MTKHVRIRSSSKNETKSKRTTLKPCCRARKRKKKKGRRRTKRKKKKYSREFSTTTRFDASRRHCEHASFFVRHGHCRLLICMRFIRKDAHERETGQGEGAGKGVGSKYVFLEWKLDSAWGIRRGGGGGGGGDLDTRNEYWSTFANRMQFFRIQRFASFVRPPFFFFRGHACAQNRGERNHTRVCMHRYSYLNCNLHSRGDGRETRGG